MLGCTMLPHDCLNNFFSIPKAGNITWCLLCGRKFKHTITYVCLTCYTTGKKVCEHDSTQKLELNACKEIQGADADAVADAGPLS